MRMRMVVIFQFYSNAKQLLVLLFRGDYMPIAYNLPNGTFLKFLTKKPNKKPFFNFKKSKQKACFLCHRKQCICYDKELKNQFYFSK